MGRAKGTNNAAAATGLTRREGREVQTTITTITIEHLIAQAEAAGDPSLGLEHALGVKDIMHLPSGQYRMTLENGNVVLVDLDNLEVAHSNGDEATPGETLGALYAAAGYRAMYATDPSTSALDDPLALLGDTYADIYNKDVPLTDAMRNKFRDEALSFIAQSDVDGKGVAVNPEHLAQALAPAPYESARTAQRKAMAAMRARVAAVRAHAEAEGNDPNLAAAQALFYQSNAQGELMGLPTAAEITEAEQHAIELGASIPELKIAMDEEGNSVGQFEVGVNEKERIDLIRNAIAYGDRTFAFRGPPGSGKGEMTTQIAAIMNMPYVPINVGPSNDLEQNIGGDGLRAKTKITYEPVLNPDTGMYKAYKKDGTITEAAVVMDGEGNPTFDEKNLPVLKGGLKPLYNQKQTVVTVSDRIYGPIAEAAQRKCVIEIMEPEGMEQEAIRLHSMLGEKIGRPDARYLNINSSASPEDGEDKEISVKVHKDCIIVFTYNPGMEDIKLKQATHDRAVNLDFDYPTKEAECRRLASMVNSVLTNQDNSLDEGLREPVTPDMMEVFVGISEKMRGALATNAGFIEAPGARTTARFALQVMSQAYFGDARSDKTAKLLLDYCRSYEEKGTTVPDTKVSQILGDEVSKLRTLAETWFQRGQQAGHQARNQED